MKYMGIDYGDTRIGISTCDTLEILATGYCTINRQKKEYSKKQEKTALNFVFIQMKLQTSAVQKLHLN